MQQYVTNTERRVGLAISDSLYLFARQLGVGRFIEDGVRYLHLQHALRLERFTEMTDFLVQALEYEAAIFAKRQQLIIHSIRAVTEHRVMNKITKLDLPTCSLWKKGHLKRECQKFFQNPRTDE